MRCSDDIDIIAPDFAMLEVYLMRHLRKSENSHIFRTSEKVDHHGCDLSTDFSLCKNFSNFRISRMRCFYTEFSLNMATWF